MSGYVSSDRFPRCIVGHRLKHRDPVLNEALTICQHRENASAPICGKRLYVCRIVRAGEPRGVARADILWFVTELSDRAWEGVRSGDLTWLERCAVAGTAAPGVLEHDCGLPPNEEAA